MQDNEHNRLAALYSTSPLRAFNDLSDDMASTIAILQTCGDAASEIEDEQSGLSYTIGLATDQLRQYDREITFLTNRLREAEEHPPLNSLVKHNLSAQSNGEIS